MRKVVIKGSAIKEFFMKDESDASSPDPATRETALAALSILINYYQTISALCEYPSIL